MRVVRSAHLTCGAHTRIRLPNAVPARAVRRVVCDGCQRPYDSHLVEEVRPSLWRDLPPGRTWRIASVAIAAVAVIGGLFLIQSLDDDSPRGPVAVPEGAGPAQARFVREPTFSLALPPGWKRTDPPRGAAFAAAPVDGTGDVTLWIERDPELDFAEFEARSLAQLRELAGTAEVSERVSGPTPEQTVIRLRADAPEGSGASAPYEVTLRAAGPYRYYLGTSLDPDPSPPAIQGVQLIHDSFTPERRR